MKIRIIAFCVMILSGQAADLAAPVVTKETVTTFYRSYEKMTPRPQSVSASLLLLCGVPSPATIEKLKSDHGPHFTHSIQVYSNEIGKIAYPNSRTSMPVGSVIVKEKLDDRGHPKGIGGMIKREASFDPTHGNWEYFYNDPTVGFSIGKLASCIGCHAKAKDDDYLFSRSSIPKS
jgi:hypothetical protein